jgi:Family of unknown function (DUF5670)
MVEFGVVCPAGYITGSAQKLVFSAAQQRAVQPAGPAQFFPGKFMLMTVAIVLVVLWLLGIVTAYTMGGLIHVLLVVAIIVMLVRVIQGRKPI